MDRYEGPNDVNALLTYVIDMKSMTVDKTHTDVCQLFNSVYTCIVVNAFEPFCTAGHAV